MPVADVRHNIILFGETGTGKSSIVNMLCNSEVAKVSSAAAGCTMSSTGYEGAIGDHLFTFWDTAGLNEGDVGKAPDMEAIVSLYRLLNKLKDGVSLLMFCMKAPRVTEAGKKNWDFCCNLMCHGRVPAVLVVTYLDQEDMGAWWAPNKSLFASNEVEPSQVRYRRFRDVVPPGSPETMIKSDVGVACITGTKGKLRKNGLYSLMEEYEESCWKLKKLVYESHLPVPWKAEPVKWFHQIVTEVKSGYWTCPDVRRVTDYLPDQGLFKLMERWGLRTVEEAIEVAKTIEASIQ